MVISGLTWLTANLKGKQWKDTLRCRMDHSMWLLQELYIQLKTYEEQFSSYLVIGANKQHSERKLHPRSPKGNVNNTLDTFCGHRAVTATSKISCALAVR